MPRFLRLLLALMTAANQFSRNLLIPMHSYLLATVSPRVRSHSQVRVKPPMGVDTVNSLSSAMSRWRFWFAAPLGETRSSRCGVSSA
ncbi:hypothetical protein C8R45DRAFT_991828 [Mycena sanguinolenta]|nr:hypothetical protein C8R45DRAFT_991828 [Mycena sanguinolenta]